MLILFSLYNLGLLFFAEEISVFPPYLYNAKASNLILNILRLFKIFRYNNVVSISSIDKFSSDKIFTEITIGLI